MTEQKNRTFESHWLHGEVQVVEAPDTGDQRETLVNAMMLAGLGGGALRALDYWREVKDE
jgi:hypothetical protein